MEKDKKSSIQISYSLVRTLKKFCKERGYTISGFTEISILNAMNGSIIKNNQS